MNTRVFAVVALLCASINGSAPNGVSKITFDGEDFEWIESEKTYLNKKGQKGEKLMLEEYARPELGEYDEDQGHLVLDFKKVLADKNSKLSKLSYYEDLEKAVELLGDQKLRAVEHNIEREKVVDKIPGLLRRWEYDMTGPQPFGSAIKFTAEKDIERHHLPDNYIASSNFDLGEWLYPIKAGEECWRIETFGNPWYYCPDSQVKEGCTERLFGESIWEAGSTGFDDTWMLECEDNSQIIYRQYVYLTEEMSLELYESYLTQLTEDPDDKKRNRNFIHSFSGSGSGKKYFYSTEDDTLGEEWLQDCWDHRDCPVVEHQKLLD